MLTRIAPTPSGFLHAGNIRNIEITRDLARRVGARIAVRIDDIDASRYRREYVEDIFAVLDRLDITWQVGPRDVADFEARYSQRRRIDYYRSELVQLRDAGLELYACTCSRAQIGGPAVGGCPGGCRSAHHPLEPGRSALRLHIPIGMRERVGEVEVDLASELGDVVLWRRDDLPAYQWVSVVEDRDLGVTHIVRGQDLVPSTAVQIHLARAIGATNVVTAEYVHHRLITGADGRKLSKSQQARHFDTDTPG